MRFEVTEVLDAIERHLTTEAALAQAVVDIGQVAWFDALDGGRPVNLLRVGLLVDGLTRHLGEDAIIKSRAKAEKALGPKFNVRAFHDTVLELGSVPIPVLQARIDRFIAEGGKGPYPELE